MAVEDNLLLQMTWSELKSPPDDNVWRRVSAKSRGIVYYRESWGQFNSIHFYTGVVLPKLVWSNRKQVEYQWVTYQAKFNPSFESFIKEIWSCLHFSLHSLKRIVQCEKKLYLCTIKHPVMSHHQCRLNRLKKDITVCATMILKASPSSRS